MFRISDDFDFDDDYLDSELNDDVLASSKIVNSGSDGTAAVRGSSDHTPLLAKPAACILLAKPNVCSSVTTAIQAKSTSGSGGFVPKSKASTAIVERKDSKIMVAPSNPRLSPHGGSLNYSPETDNRRVFKTGNELSVNLNSKPSTNQSTLSLFPAGHIQSTHSAFLAEWNDDTFFNPSPKDRPSGLDHLSSTSASPMIQSRIPDAVTRQVNKRLRRRKFPGPAGLLPPRQGNTSLIAPEEFLDELRCEENDPTYEETDVLSQSSGSIFESGAWSAMLEDLGTPGKHLLKNMNLASVEAIGRNLRIYKVPFLAVLVKSVDISLPDAAVVFKDPTGEMHGVVHRDVWEQFSSDIAIGTVLVLRNVGIISAGMSSRKHVVNVTGNNLTAIYSPKDELNIQLRQIHAFATNNSSKLLDEWEKVESLSMAPSPLPCRATKTPMCHSTYNHLSSKAPSRFNSPSSGGMTRFNSPTIGGVATPSRFSAPSPAQGQTIPPGHSSSNSPFSPLPSRLGLNGITTQTPHLSPNNENSRLAANLQRPMPLKSPNFSVKAPRNLLGDNHLSPSNKLHSVLNDSRQQWPSINQLPPVPIKKPKICQSQSNPSNASNTKHVPVKSNPFQVDPDTSAIDSLLEGIDTDSLFGDF